jgi:hypothetical protein
LKNKFLVKKIKISLSIYIVSILTLCVFAFSMGCRGSYISGYSLDPDTTNHNSTIFNEIIDSDSSLHWYVKLYDGELWCYYHNRYEMVKRVRR